MLNKISNNWLYVYYSQLSIGLRILPLIVFDAASSSILFYSQLVFQCPTVYVGNVGTNYNIISRPLTS